MCKHNKPEDTKEIPVAFKEMEEPLKGGIPVGSFYMFTAYTNKTKSKLESN